MRQPITIDRAGRIVLPIDVRRRLNLGPGARLALDVVAGRVELTPLPQTDTELLVTPGRRTVLRPTGTPFDAAAATRAERQAQAGRGGRR
jgi:AbrB family looped-hinge helix DNA binding protein